MNKITNRQAIRDTLMEAAETDKDTVALYSGSRGPASLVPFFKQYPKQYVEAGITEQNLVMTTAGPVSCREKSFAVSPAGFLSIRSYEQAKMGVAYSGDNVTLVGISGGISYGVLGVTHHPCQNVAAFTVLPGIGVYTPNDRSQIAVLIKTLLEDDRPVHVRMSRSATEDVYDDPTDFSLDKAQVIKERQDVLIMACGEMVPNTLQAAGRLEADGIHASVIDMYCLKPFDEKTLLEYAGRVRLVVMVEEHSPYDGLGSLIALTLARRDPKHIFQITLPDGHIVAGTNKEAPAFYGMDADGIAE